LIADDTVQRMLATAKAQETRDVLVHADLRLSNILFGIDEVRLIDWESVGWGTAALDLGALFGSIWYALWPRSSPKTAWVQEGKALLEAILEGYETHRRWEPDCGINAALSFVQYAIEDAGRDRLSTDAQQVVETAMLLKRQIDDASQR
jgi:aminoglycoside phosphotransferase (APT) family kinase protein